MEFPSHDLEALIGRGYLANRIVMRRSCANSRRRVTSPAAPGGRWSPVSASLLARFRRYTTYLRAAGVRYVRTEPRRKPLSFQSN